LDVFLVLRLLLVEKFGEILLLTNKKYFL